MNHIIWFISTTVLKFGTPQSNFAAGDQNEDYRYELTLR